jgi:hypothetical protein
MATGAEVLSMLCPDTEWVITENDYDSIQWIKGDSITKSQFDAGFAKVDKAKADQEAAKQSAKATAEAKLAALGLTADDLKALGL